MHQYLLRVFFGAVFIVSVACQTPGYFDRNCPSYSKNQVRKCKIYVETNLDFRDFRDWSSRLKKDVKISLDVSCGSHGRVFLPLQMKAKGLTKLVVSGCIIDGFESEFNKSSGIKDNMQEYIFENNIYSINLDKFLDINYEQATPEYYCGPQAVESIVRRNISYTYKKPFTINQFGLLIQFIESEQKRYKCVYPNLKFLDQSIGRPASKLRLTANAEYPNLQTFLIADNGYSYIPQELVDWRSSFPRLSYLDMSRNNITKFDFLGTSFSKRNIRRSSPLVVDLSHNMVKVIPLDIEDYMSETVQVIVDLTGNPLICNCNFIRYKWYVKKVVNHFPKYKKLYQITCYSRNQRRRLKMRQFVDKNCLS